MANFIINGKEHELKINYAGVKYLNKIYEGGSYEIIGKAIMGDLDTFPHIVYAALKHTGEAFTLQSIEDAITEAIEAERMDLDSIVKVSNEVVTQSFFYKATVAKLLKDNKAAQKALDQMLK